MVSECSHGESVGPADPDHAAVGQVDEAVTGHQRALLAVERAVVRGHGSVDPVAADRSGQAQERARGGAGLGVHHAILSHHANLRRGGRRGGPGRALPFGLRAMERVSGGLPVEVKVVP